MGVKQNGDRLVSVIIPAYQRAYILRRAITSVLAQTYRRIELIVVDDGSTDNTEEIVRSFPDPRVRYIRHKENKGLSTARNTGIKAARGEYIALLDSDDEYMPEKIEKCMNVFLGSERGPGMVSSNYYKNRDGNRVLAVSKKTRKKRLFPHVSGWVIKKDVFEKVGLFDERIFISEDVDFYKRLRKRTGFYFIEEPLFNIYHMSDGFFFDMQKAIERRKKYLDKLKGDKRLHAMHINYLAKDYLNVGDKALARKYFLKAFVTYPVNMRYLFKYLRLFSPSSNKKK